MIIFRDLSQEAPFLRIYKEYKRAHAADQQAIDAISISSFNKLNDEVDSRYVNLKFVEGDSFVFFSNYNSPKAIQFNGNNKISALIYWPSINIQIRMKAHIKKTAKSYNNSYFHDRSIHKNALAISSNQSQAIHSYEQVIVNYINAKENQNLKKCPDYWGGYSFIPYYFEFWEGHSSRLNRRDAYEKNGNNWNHSILQP